MDKETIAHLEHDGGKLAQGIKRAGEGRYSTLTKELTRLTAAETEQVGDHLAKAIRSRHNTSFER